MTVRPHADPNATAASAPATPPTPYPRPAGSAHPGFAALIATVGPALLARILPGALAHADVLGESLRADAFVGEGLGGYTTMDFRDELCPVEDPVAKGAHPLTVAIFGPLDPANEEGDGFGDAPADLVRRIRLAEGPEYDVLLYWDGDGTLAFRHRGLDAIVVTGDCKHTTEWSFRRDPRLDLAGSSDAGHQGASAVASAPSPLRLYDVEGRPYAEPLAPRAGALALCSLGLLGRITSETPVPVTYADGRPGLAWVGVQCAARTFRSPFTGEPVTVAAGDPWSSRTPLVLGYDDAIRDAGAGPRGDFTARVWGGAADDPEEIAAIAALVGRMPRARGWVPLLEILARAVHRAGATMTWKSKYEGIDTLVATADPALDALASAVEALSLRVDPLTGAARPPR